MAGSTTSGAVGAISGAVDLVARWVVSGVSRVSPVSPSGGRSTSASISKPGGDESYLTQMPWLKLSQINQGPTLQTVS